MRIYLLPALLALILLVAPLNCLADPDPLTPAKKAGIRHLMMLTGVDHMQQTLAGHLRDQLHQILASDNDNVPVQLDAIIDFEVGALMDARFSQLQEKLVHIYAKHFTHDEIKQMIAFYRSDVGKKALKELPVIIGESRRTGQQWGQQMVAELIRRIDTRLSAGTTHPTK